MRSALTKLPAIKELKTTPASGGGKANFKVAKDFDFKKEFDAIVAAGNTHLKGYKVLE